MAESKKNSTEQNVEIETFAAVLATDKPAAPTENPNAKYKDYAIPERFQDPRTFVIAGYSFMEKQTNRDKVKVNVVSSRLPDPFGDEDFIDVPIAPKWANSGGIFKYLMTKALKEMPRLEYPVIVTPITFYSKKAKKELTIAGMFIKNPFGDGYIEFQVHEPQRDQEKAAVFAMLVSARWQMQLDVIPTDDDEDNA